MIRREFTSTAPLLRPRSERDYAARPVTHWEELVAGGHTIGLATAQFQVLEFADFECPACREFTLGALRALREQHPRDVSIVFRHWPLPYHRFAMRAAEAAECAADQGRFEQMHDLLFALQDSLGLKPFTEFAADAGLPDPEQFGRCINATSLPHRVVADVEAVRQLGGVGTPTVIINGKLLGGVPDSAGLFAIFNEWLRSTRSG